MLQGDNDLRRLVPRNRIVLPHIKVKLLKVILSTGEEDPLP